MVRVISQETFDAVVKENMEEFDMNREEAVKEAVEQFQSQGVELSNIVTDSISEDHPIVQTIRRLETLSKEKPDNDSSKTIIENCDVLAFECCKGLAEKMLATKEGCYELLVAIAENSGSEIGVRESALKALSSLLEGNPDPLDESGFKIIADTLDLASSDAKHASLAKSTLNLTLNCCVRHEQNRQNLVKHGLLDKLDVLVDVHPVEVARIWQALVQDDDVRVPFGKAHDHAREIVEEHQALDKLGETIKDNDLSLKDLVLLLSAMSSLCVRNEYCQAVVDGGSLSRIFLLLINPDQRFEIVKECLKLLKVLAGNDNVKRDIAASQGIVTMINSVNKHLTNSHVCKAGCSAISALCLRTPENCKQVMEAGGAQMIAQVIKIHIDDDRVLASSASAIRNIVSRSREFCNEFIDLEIEPLLNEVLTKHPQTSDEVRAALRDLGLKVHLNEEWKGDPINIRTDFQPTWD